MSSGRVERLGLVVLLSLAAVVQTRGADCDADLDGSGVVDFPDLVTLLAAWGPCRCCPADLDANGAVDFPDLLALLAAWETMCPDPGFIAVDVVGRPLHAYPFVQRIRAVNEHADAWIAIDPASQPQLVGRPVLVYVTTARTAEMWDTDPLLTDVRGAPQPVMFAGPGIQDATIMLTGALSGDAGIGFGVGYDVVIDGDRDGVLGSGDVIDGYGDEAGFFVVADPVEPGPLAVSTFDHDGGDVFLRQEIYHPTEIGTLGALPLIALSPASGAVRTWYAYLGEHIASYGFIVIAHNSNTGPGIETGSTSTLTNTDHLLGNLGTIGGGFLEGHVDGHAIVWIGHQRGGEAVVRAYDRLVEGHYVPEHYATDDVVLVSTIGPTNFLRASPHDVDFFLLYGSADGDINGSPTCRICQPFRIFERARSWRASHYVQGADSRDFNCCGFNDFDGPAGTAIGRVEAQRVAKGAYVALLQHRLRGSLAAKDYLTRQYEDLPPPSVAATTIVDIEYRDGPDAGNVVIDDFQTETSTDVSSSGGAVTGEVTNRIEGVLDDGDSSFTWLPSDPWNGMTRADVTDTTRGTVFDWTDDAFLEFEILGAHRDMSGGAFLSFRACQGTRHPNTVAELEDLTFAVTLRDDAGVTSSINIGAYGGGVEEPYQRTGSGDGAGWGNEFETIRIRLTDFQTDGNGLNLTCIDAIRFDFGPSFGAAAGRLGFDDIEITRD